jgi:hypothetical protein
LPLLEGIIAKNGEKMAELILTQEEKDAEFWSDVPDETLGKLIKAGIIKFKSTSKELGKMYEMSAAMMLAEAAYKTNADEMKITLEGLSVKTGNIGNWLITVKRVSK